MKEPTGLLRTDNKRPDGLTLIPWQKGKPVTLADSYLADSAQSAGAAAELAATRKIAKYSTLPASHSFQPIALETHGPINHTSVDFMTDLGHRISSVTGEEREKQFLFQRIAVVLQRYNAVLLHDSFDLHVEDDLDL